MTTKSRTPKIYATQHAVLRAQVIQGSNESSLSSSLSLLLSLPSSLSSSSLSSIAMVHVMAQFIGPCLLMISSRKNRSLMGLQFSTSSRERCQKCSVHSRHFLCSFVLEKTAMWNSSSPSSSCDRKQHCQQTFFKFLQLVLRGFLAAEESTVPKKRLNQAFIKFKCRIQSRRIAGAVGMRIASTVPPPSAHYIT
jgi:hypothetical protein